ncbi:MAG: metallophosphoesterase [Fusobacteria bacterium]|nr:metallophosphoesterase [Fusobacteriota bacterium]
MSKIGIVSDTHDHMGNIGKIVEIFNQEKVDLVIHCGDIVSPFAARHFEGLNAKMVAVYGNNDGEHKGLFMTLEGNIFAEPYILEYEGKKICVAHHPFIIEKLKEKNVADIYLFGHTHIKSIENNPFVINPGEGCGYLTGIATVAVLDTQNMSVDFRVVK